MKNHILILILLVVAIVASGQQSKPDRLTRLQELVNTGKDPTTQNPSSPEDLSKDLAVIRAAIADPSRQQLLAMDRILLPQRFDRVYSKLNEQEVIRMLLLSIWLRSDSRHSIGTLQDEIEGVHKDVIAIREDMAAIKRRLGIDEGFRPTFPNGFPTP